jgi:hypothetical protein
MNKFKAKGILDLWRQCQKEALTWDSEGKINGTDFNLAKKMFIRNLKDGGCKCIGEGAYKLVLSKEDFDFVVKIYHTGAIDDKCDNRLKLMRYYLKPYYKSPLISIQPKVKLSKKHNAFKLLETILGEDYCRKFDVHADNVGWLNNAPVIFDYII